VSHIFVTPPSDSDDVISRVSGSCDRSKFDLTWARFYAPRSGYSGWCGRAFILLACCLILILIVSGCGYSVKVSAASSSTSLAASPSTQAAISFVQVASATPQTSTATVSVSYPTAQTLGDMNVVVVGWNDTTATVQSVKDSAGNTYKLAIGPTSGTALRQSIYYAANIASGSNTVTATFSQAAVSPDVRILEYRGVTTLDVVAGASGNSASASSGAATTTSANELIFGADMVYTTTGAAGSGFTSRIITSPDSDLAEDEVVTAAGSNSATATLTSSGPWVMQMATFSAAAGSAVSTAQLTVSPSSLSFGNVAAGSSSTLPVTLTSSGTSAVTVNSATISGTGFTVSGATFPVTLNPKQTLTLNVKFAPTTAGAVTGTLSLSSNSSTNATVGVGVSGTGTGTPQWSMSSTSLSFGSVAVGSNTTLPVTITSSGTSAVTVNAATISGSGFTVSGATFPVTLNPKQTLTLNVKFAPTAAGAVAGTLSLSSNASTNATAGVSLSGTGTTTPQLTMSSTSLSFGDVTVHSNATLGVTLTSAGATAVTINSATISGTGFTVSGATFPVTLNPQQAITLQVKFAPTAASSVTGTLTISSNSSTNATASISLSGTGTPPEVSLTWSAPTSSPAPVTGYNIYRSTGSSSSFQLMNSSIDTQTSYMDTTVVSGTAYTYYVESVGASGMASAPSTSVSVTIP
jgi:hypothetical protein